MDVGSPTATKLGKEITAKIVHACAEACGVSDEMVEKICPASGEQEYRMDHHIMTGSSYMMQIVLHNESGLNLNFLFRALGTMRFKNHVLRTRLIKHAGQVYQAVLRDSIVCQQIVVDLHAFLAQNSRTRMDYGTPLFRYDFVREPYGEAFFVWTVHCSAVDSWTLGLIFDELQTACSDLRAYCKLPSPPPYGKYANWIQSRDYDAGQTFWLTRLMTFDSLALRFPVLGPGGIPSASTMKTKKLLHLPKVEDTEFDLPTMGHAAWALTIANRLTQGDPPLIYEDISFISMNSARKNEVLGITRMMGPISTRVPLRIRFFPDLSIEDLMCDIDTQFSSMVGFEHCAMKVLSDERGFQNMPKQAVFNWNPPDSDLSSKRIVCYDKEAAPAVLAYREDLSVPSAHDYGLMFEVYEHGGHIAIYASWDHGLVSRELVSSVSDDFGGLLSLIVRTQGVTVSELLSRHRVGRLGEVAGF